MDLRNYKKTAFSILFITSSIVNSAVIAQETADAGIAKLKDSIYTLDEVVITGQYKPVSLKQSVYKVRSIGQERIKLRAATDIIGLLNNEVGIRFGTDNTIGETDINIMGMSGQNVKVLLDGVPLVDRGSTKQSLSQVDVNSIEKIEIVEGPMSVIYGTDALAGVINIITKKNNGTKKLLSVSARVLEESSGEYYSPFSSDGQHNENVGVNWQGGKWNASGSVSRNSFGGWTGNAALRAQESKPKDQYLFGGTVGFRHQNFNTWYRLDYLDEDIYVAGALNTNNYRAKDQHYYTSRFTHQLQNEWQVNNHFRLSSAVSYQDYKRSTETYTVDYAKKSKTFSTEEGEQDVTTFKTFFLRTTALFAVNEKLSMQPGVEFKSDFTSGQRIAGEPSINDFSLFATGEYKPVAGIGIRPGIRFTNNSVYKAPPVIPSLNLKFALNKKFDLRLSYGRGFRAPALRELYFLFKDATHDILGNTTLKAEYSNSYMASLSWNAVTSPSAKLTSVVTGFYNDFQNKIDLAIIPNSTVYTYFNITKFKTTGATLENSLVWKNLSATIGLSYIGRYNLYKEDKTFQDEDLPQFTWSPEVSSNIILKVPKVKAEVGLFYKHTGKLPSYATAPDQAGQSEIFLTEIDSYHWADITLSKKLFKYFTIQAGAKNLFDVTRLANTNAETGSIHNGGGNILSGYGRTGFVGVNFQWDKK